MTDIFEVLVGDARVYDAWAREIAGGDLVGREVFYQAPLYPYVVGAVYTGFGAEPLAVERASSPGVDSELLASIRRQSVSLDVLDIIGVDERTAEAIAEAREAMGFGSDG